ncbi:putative lipid II flippase FtsW [Bacillus sp. S/N-304-OC-R1]|uniref:putative lipid II flippase FtsW n=1 Tax=Bacillus sp. S/N-304-OC-R1 TaxID=2758034 RepID=UPI001C8DC6F2|nr:putative lipid II flippase FtsW [Bacillus sp. S/N-304-OC-R1]MBY0123762.1 putative lipid II flippase FtsW [Bacillus sp. S/N-304-OC-R1]
MALSRLKKYDYLLVLAIVLLCLFGLTMVFSASYPLAMLEHHPPRFFLIKQMQSLGIGLVFFVITAILPYRIYGKLSPIFVVISIFLLIAVLIPGIGVERNYSQRWLKIGSFIIQPTEAVKLAMIVYFAYIYAKKQEYIHHFWKGVMPPLFILGIVFTLILKQPDLGTATAILIPCGFILSCSGPRKIHIIFLGVVALCGIATLAMTASYRLERLLSYLNPFGDPDGNGYQLVNSYFALSSGGLWGRGLGNSIQKLGYLPEAHTDFIMSIIVEELGVIGLLFVIGSYLFIMYRGMRIAQRSTESFPKLLAIGLTFQIMIQAIFNLGAVSGLLPITGVPLPFISYGGSSLIIMLISSGILVNLSYHANRAIEKKEQRNIDAIDTKN